MLWKRDSQNKTGEIDKNKGDYLSLFSVLELFLDYDRFAAGSLDRTFIYKDGRIMLG